MSDCSDDSFDNDDLMCSDSHEPTNTYENEEKERKNSAHPSSSGDVEDLTSALEVLETEPVIYKQLTMQEEIDALSEEHAKVYHSYLQSHPEIDFSTPTDPEFTGAQEHVDGYFMEQTYRFLAMSEVWKSPQELKPEAEIYEKLSDPIDSLTVDTVTGHYGLYQISIHGKSFLTATAFQENLKVIGKVRVDQNSILISENEEFQLNSLDVLMLGDTIAVKEIVFEFGKNFVRKFLLLKRKIVENQHFHIGRHLKPVILGSGEIGVIKKIEASGTTHIGAVFFPAHYEGLGRHQGLPIAQPIILSFENEKKLTSKEQFYSNSMHHRYSPEILDYFVCLASSAITAERRGVLDPIFYSINTNCIKLEGQLVKFMVPFPATSKTWVPGMQVEIQGVGRAEITYSPDNKQKSALITAKPLVGFKTEILDSKSTDSRKVYQVAKQHPPCIPPGFFGKMEDATNGKRIIKALFGGVAIGTDGTDSDRIGFGCRDDGIRSVPFPECEPVSPAKKPYLGVLDAPQSTYIQNIVTGKLAVTVGNFPVESGKTTAIVVAAVEAALAKPGTQQLILVPDARGAQLLVNRLTPIIENTKIGALRLIGTEEWKNLGNFERTSLDYPILLQKLLQDIKNGEDPELITRVINDNYSEDYQYFSIIRPQIIIGQFSTIFSNPNYLQLLNNVATIQFDDVDQIPQIDLIHTCLQYPHANYGLIGDASKDRPYFDTMSAHQAAVATGWLVEKSIIFKLFPVVTSNCVYAINPLIVELIGKVWYKDRQLIAIRDSGAEAPIFVAPRPDIWPRQYPIRILNHYYQKKENVDARQIDLLCKLINKLAYPQGNLTAIPVDQIGIVCMLHRHASMLHQVFKNSGIQVGLDSEFQGIQKEILIIWGAFGSFKNPPLSMNRSTLMLTRGKQAVIILGNTYEMSKMEADRKNVKWDEVVKIVAENGGIVNADTFIESRRY